MSKLRYKEGGVWKSIAPSQKEFDDNKAETDKQFKDIAINIKTLGAKSIEDSAGFDSTIAIQNGFNLGDEIYFPDGEYWISSEINLSSHKIIRSKNAIIRQTVANKAIFKGANIDGLNVDGIKFIGKSTDYTDAASHMGIAIMIQKGVTKSKNIHITNCTFEGFAYAGVYLLYCDNVVLRDNTIKGTLQYGLDEGKYNQFGFYLVDVSNIKIESNNISFVNQGFIASICENLDVNSNTIYDIVGQHAMYIANGRKIKIQNNTTLRTNYQSMKIQIDNNAISDVDDVIISDNSFLQPGIHGIAIANNASAPTPMAYRIKNIIISGNIIEGKDKNTGEGFSLQHIIGGKIFGNKVLYAGRGFLINHSNDVTFSFNEYKNLNKQVGLIEAGCSNIFIEFDSAINNNLIQSTSEGYGFQISTIEAVTLKGVRIRDDNSYCLGALFVIAGGDKLTIEDCNFEKLVIRFYSGISNIKRFNNNRYSTIYGSPWYPTGIVEGHKNRVFHGTSAIPTNGVWAIGDMKYNTPPVAGGYIGYVCMTAGTASNTPWVATTAYVLNTYVFVSNRVYKCSIAGTSGAVAPTHVTGSAIDGSVTWDYVGVLAVFKGFGLIQA